MKRTGNKRFKLQAESDWISRENCCVANTAKQSKRFPGRICAASKNCVFKQKMRQASAGNGRGVISYTTPGQEDGLDAS